MPSHEYRVLPAPRRGVKVRGVRGEEARFAAAVEAEMNRMAAEGWEFVRSDTLPSEERTGWLGGRSTVFRTLLVFRREVVAQAPATTAFRRPTPVPVTPPAPPVPHPPSPRPPMPRPVPVPPVEAPPSDPAIGTRPRAPEAVPLLREPPAS
jgi:hypothetical protein